MTAESQFEAALSLHRDRDLAYAAESHTPAPMIES
jgi:hypothetical protein